MQEEIPVHDGVISRENMRKQEVLTGNQMHPQLLGPGIEPRILGAKRYLLPPLQYASVGHNLRSFSADRIDIWLPLCVANAKIFRKDWEK